MPTKVRNLKKYKSSRRSEFRFLSDTIQKKKKEKETES